MNRLATLVDRIAASGLPPSMQSMALTLMFNTQVKFAGTAGIRIHSLSSATSVVSLQNRWRIQNHIGGIHACGTALLGESATGMLFGMHVPDTHVPLLKSMKIEYVRRAQGALTNLID